MTDISRIQSRHAEINQRCETWGKWAKVKTRPFGMQPMWKNYMSTARHWDIDPLIPVAINELEALETERSVSMLPESDRTILRWHYVWPALHPNAVARELHIQSSDLATARDNALDRLVKEIAKKSRKHDKSMV